ncbi:MAG: hypothetical protein ACOC3V_02950 [bacterium]
MLLKNFKSEANFDIIHFTGNKIYPSKRSKKLHYVYDKFITFSIFLPSTIRFEKGNISSDKLDKYFMNITYLQDKDRYSLIKQVFQRGLELG